MPTFTATIEAVFAASHALRLPDGTLEPVHGHNWPVRVTVASATLDAMDTVVDFHDLERWVEAVLAPWRNRHLNDVAPFADDAGRLAVNPSAERVAEHIGRAVQASLPERVTLVEVAVGEAPGCTAGWSPT